MYGCPAYIHPEDRFMLTDPIKDFGPRLAQIAFGALFREPKQVVELDSDGDKIEVGGVTVDGRPYARTHPRLRGVPGLRRT